ncbi:MAG: Polysaccharide deacetylase [Candidatus Levybacteria bacterium GW2011_GWA1_39_11]|uniref:Polysaccharide deacetylase n=1 Tax=Candidatus Daviesbacteria bacterium GW2011_GWB1_41_5 TaxID=1618429 RepID=A0A0G0WFY7_9BACT|nr:MAG: Polysaccharide deacetylase [Candidatus Levybacteria bacterium GW2011_GWA1_39_11]KKS11845.1 MAG: Polysaccharide deacetylase [Candidatus Daviesbacteria bacterium GW2011_GWB1_41_5]
MGNTINIMNNNLKKIKVYFSITVLLLMVTIFSGGFFLKNNTFFTTTNLAGTFNYFKYKTSFVYSDNKNLTASVISIFQNNPQVNQGKGKVSSIPVLLYHGVVDNSDDANILLKDFRNQMFALKKAGWQTINIEDFYAFMESEKELPDKSFLLTFDDGRKDSYYPVDPILKALDYNAVIFVITKYSLEDKSSNYYLSKNELKRMVKSGRWEIEAHTREGHNIYKIAQDGKLGHYHSNKLWLDSENRPETEEEFINRIKTDFAIAKNDIEQGLGTEVISFAFPFGDFGQNTVNFLKVEQIILDAAKSVYPITFYQVWPGKGYNFNYPAKDSFLIKRIEVKSDWNTEALMTILDAGKEKSLPYFDNFEKYRGWTKTWGQLTLGNNSMILDSNASTTGSSAFLDGSYLWDNYSYSANINLVKGRNISLLARYKDDENYTACNFSGDSVRIEQRLNNKNRVMVEIKNYVNFPKNDLNLGIKVNKDKVECLVNDNIVAYTYYLSPALSNGGIGFKIWDPQMNNSELIVRHVSVEEIK